MIHVITGKGFYGKVDKVPGFFHITTHFFHMYYVPLVPLKSYIVPRQQAKNASGIPIPLQPRSVLMAYGIGFLPAVWLVAGICTCAFITSARDDANPWIPGTIAAIAFALWLLFLLASLIGKANYKRACQLGVIVGLDDEGWQKLNALFGRAGSLPQPT